MMTSEEMLSEVCKGSVCNQDGYRMPRIRRIVLALVFLE